MDTPSHWHARSRVARRRLAWMERRSPPRAGASQAGRRAPLDPEELRRCAWEIGEEPAADAYVPATNHVGLAMVTPYQGFAHWRILPGVGRADGPAARRRLARLPARVCASTTSPTSSSTASTPIASRTTRCRRCAGSSSSSCRGRAPGSWPRSASSCATASSSPPPARRSCRSRRDAASRRRRPGRPAAWTSAGAIERSATSGSRRTILRERRRPQLRHPLRIAAFAFARRRRADGMPGPLRPRTGRPARRPRPRGPRLRPAAAGSVRERREVDGVHYHPLPVPANGSPAGAGPGVRPGRRGAPARHCRRSTCSTCTSG